MAIEFKGYPTRAEVEEQLGYTLFRAPEAHDAGGAVVPHKFVDGAPYYAACLACGGAASSKRGGKPVHP